MTDNQHRTVTAGQFSFSHGSQVFTGIHNSALRSEATELHESVHAQLFHMSCFGGLTHLLQLLADNALDSTVREFAREASLRFFSAQRFVQEVIANTAAILFLEEEGYFDAHALEEVVAPSYMQYLEPLENYRHTVFSSRADAVEGTINLGLAALCSPVAEHLAALRPPFDIESIDTMLQLPGIDPTHRLHSILDTLADNEISVSMLNSQTQLDRAKHILQKHGIPLCEVLSEPEATEYKELILSMPIFTADLEGLQNLTDSVEFRSEYQELDDWTSKTTAFMVRHFGPRYVPADLFENVLTSLADCNTTPILEMRAEDIVPDPNEEGKHVMIERDLVLCHLFAAAGDIDHYASSIVRRKQLGAVVKSAGCAPFLALYDSAGYDFMRGKWRGKHVQGEHFVIVPLANCKLLERMLMLHPFRKRAAMGVIQMEDPHIVLFAFRLPYVVPARNCYAVLPSSENLWAYVVEGRGISNAISLVDADQFEAEFPVARLGLIAEHLGRMGWATQNAANEDPDVFVPLVE